MQQTESQLTEGKDGVLNRTKDEQTSGAAAENHCGLKINLGISEAFNAKLSLRLNNLRPPCL